MYTFWSVLQLYWVKHLKTYSNVDLEPTMTNIYLVGTIFIYYSIQISCLDRSVMLLSLSKKHIWTDTHTHTHLDGHTQTNSDEYSLVVICKT